MRIIVFGPTNFDKQKFVQKKLEKITKKIKEVIVVTGEGPGVNRIAAAWGLEKWKVSETTHIKENKYKDNAIKIWTEELFDGVKAVIIFWDGKCKTTKKILEETRRRKLLLRLIKIKN